MALFVRYLKFFRIFVRNILNRYEKGYCYKSYKQLMEIIDLKERQFYYCLDNLKRFELITIEKNNNRTYLMPKINKIYLEAQQKRTKMLEEYKQSDIFGYDWLNDK